MRGGDGDGDGGGAQHAAQLARVTERWPRIAAIPSAHKQQQQQLRLVVKIRSQLAHYIVNGVVMCVIASLEPITDVAELASKRSGADAQLLVAVADGTIWRVTLPAEPLSVLRHVLLQQGSPQRMALSSAESTDTPTQVLDLMEDDPLTTQDAVAAANACRVERFCHVPGVQIVQQSGDCTVCTSVVAPSTLVWTALGDPTTTGKPSGALSMVELDELEAEQSTCVLALRGGDEGDVDGAVRFYWTIRQGMQAQTQPPRSGTLLELGEPVQLIVPFATNVSDNSSRSRGLLVVGCRGCARLLLLRSDTADSAVEAIPIAFDTPVQAMAFVESLDCFVFCSSGAVYGFRASDVIRRSESAAAPTDSPASSDSKKAAEVAPQTDFAAKLPFVSGVASLALHEDSQAVSLVYASGRVVSMDRTRFAKAVELVLPREVVGAEAAVNAPVVGESSSSQSLLSGDTNESRIKSLLQRISQVSTSSSALHAHSEQLDAHLRRLHAALLMQKHVEAHGIQSIFQCKLDLSMRATGSLSPKKAPSLTCRIDAATAKLDFMSSLSCWFISIHVRSRQQLVTTFVFPLEDVLHSQVHGGQERSMFFDDDTLEFQDNGGVLFVSCSLVFQPGSLYQESRKREEQQQRNSGNVTGVSEIEDTSRSLFSFAMPLVQDKEFYLVHLSEILDGDSIPTSHTAIRAAFRQDHEPSLATASSPAIQSSSRTNSASKDNPSGLLLQGFQLWSALAAHWEDKAFAALWLRDLQSSSQAHQALEVAPPSRFTMVFPAFALKELSADHVVAVVRTLLNLPASMKGKLYESIRSQSGKFWLGVRTFAGSLVVLRFSLAEGTIVMDGEMLQPLEVLLQCSSAEDLSVMRALLMKSVPRRAGHEEMSMPLDEVFAALSLEASAFRDALHETEALAEVVAEKISTSLESADSSLCTEEVVRMVADLARVETQTLELYWKSRRVLNKFVI